MCVWKYEEVAGQTESNVTAYYIASYTFNTQSDSIILYFNRNAPVKIYAMATDADN